VSLIHLKGPPGFVSNKKPIPGMTLVDEPTHEPWMATRTIKDQDHILTVTWNPEGCQYVCSYTVEDSSPKDLQAFDYPHEVVGWVGSWYRKLHTRALQVEDE
jgi:hypothetical protein